MSNEVLTKVGNKAEWAAGGGGSVPKPLTYDYMPEGYPSKTIGTTTLMEEQELAFALEDGRGIYVSPPTTAPEVVVGQTYTVNWDGTEYECVCFDFESTPMIGNISIVGFGDDTGEPFLYTYNIYVVRGTFGTHDTSASHTISVKTVGEVITPMAEEFLPPEVNELIMNSSTTGSTKKFKITVDDSGIISATEVT